MPNIVCVDDDPLFHEIVREAAAQVGASSTALSTIAEARATIPSAAADVVIVDGLLPDGAGASLIRELRMEMGFSGPIVFASAFFKDLRSFQKLRASGANRILQKPIDTETLRRELAALISKPAAPQGGEARVLVKLEQLQSRYRGRLGAKADEIEALTTRARDEDADARAQLALRVHAVAGTAGSFGLPRLSELARALDTRIQGGDPIVECHAGLQRLLDEMRRSGSAGESGLQQPGSSMPWPWSMLLVTADHELGKRHERELATEPVHLRVARSVDDAIEALQRFWPDVLIFDSTGLDSGTASAATTRAFTLLVDRLPVVKLTQGEPRPAPSPSAPTSGTLELVRDRPTSELLSGIREAFTRPFAGSTILIIDHDMSASRLADEAVGSLGVVVKTAPDLSGFTTHLEAGLPDLLMLEVDLPGMSGLEICRLARADPRLRDIPILCTSAKADHDLRMRVARVGADELLAKPMTSDYLAARVIERLKRCRLAEIWVESLRGRPSA